PPMLEPAQETAISEGLQRQLDQNVLQEKLAESESTRRPSEGKVENLGKKVAERAAGLELKGKAPSASKGLKDLYAAANSETKNDVAKNEVDQGDRKLERNLDEMIPPGFIDFRG